MDPDLRHLERRPGAYWFADGIPDLVIGGNMFLCAALWLIGMNLPHRAAVWIPFWILVPIGLTVLGLRQRRIISRLKERITDPRTGHIAPAEPSGKARWIGYGIAALYGGMILYAVVTGRGLARLPMDVVLGYGASAWLGLVLCIVGLRRRRYLIPAAVAWAATAMIYARGLGLTGFLYTLGTVGLTLLVLGALGLRRYLQAHPRPEAAE